LAAILICLIAFLISGCQEFIDRGVKDFQIATTDILLLPNRYTLVPSEHDRHYIVNNKGELGLTSIIEAGWSKDYVLCKRLSDTSDELEIALLNTKSGEIQTLDNMEQAIDIIGTSIELKSVEQLVKEKKEKNN